MASLLDLPNEVILRISKLCNTHGHNCLAQANRGLHDLLNPLLYKRNVRDELASARFWAARHGRLDTLELLRIADAEWNDNSASCLDTVQRLAWPNGLDDDIKDQGVSFSPLHIAAQFGQDAAISWLLDHGARIEAVSRNICLCQTTHDGHVDLRDVPLLTPLHIASCNRRLKTAKLLLSRGAGTMGYFADGTTQFDGRAETGLHAAARMNDAETVCFLLENALVDIDSGDRYQYTALHWACSLHEDPRALKALLLHGPDPNVEEFQGWTPFSLACMDGCFIACLALIEHAPNLRTYLSAGSHGIRCFDGRGGTPCHAAVLPISAFGSLESRDPSFGPDAWEANREAFLRRLTDKKSPVLDVDILNAQKETPLNFAARVLPPASVVQCLLDNGADVNHQDQQKMRTPLRTVLEKPDLNRIAAIVVTLLRHGGRLDIECSHGTDALHAALGVARDSKDYAIVDHLLLHASAENFEEGKEEYLSATIVESLALGLYDECRELMRHGGRLDVNPSTLTEWVDKSLGYSGQRPSPVEIEFYLDTYPNLVTSNDAMRKALWNFFDDSSRFPHDFTEVCKRLLVRPDFKLDPQTPNRTTLLHLACRLPLPLDIIRPLLVLGSNPNLFNERFHTPLTGALINRHSRTADMLLKHGADPFLRPTGEEWIEEYAGTFHDLGQVRTYRSPFEVAVLGRHDPSFGFFSAVLKHYQPRAPPAIPYASSYIQHALFDTDLLGTLLRKDREPNENLEGLNHNRTRVDLAFRAVHMLLKHGAKIPTRSDEGAGFIELVRETSRDGPVEGAKLADFKGSENDKEMLCSLLFLCSLAVDAAPAEESIISLRNKGILDAESVDDYLRRRIAWREAAQEEKENGGGARRKKRRGTRLRNGESARK